MAASMSVSEPGSWRDRRADVTAANTSIATIMSATQKALSVLKIRWMT